jgi:hypothetical protein
LLHKANFRISPKTLPLALALICILAFGLLIPFLGFYQDDWHPVYYGYSRGLSSLWELFLYDGRPFAAAVFVSGFRLLGFKPLNWQLFALALRILTVVFTWLTLNDIWPQKKRPVAWVALLFAVYPLFKLQSLSLIYSLHWTGFTLYSISIWAMVQAVRRPGRYWIFTILSLLTGALDLLLLEYFAGIELARPLILFLCLRDRQAHPALRLRRTAGSWLPYLLLLALYGVYRLFFLPAPAKGAVSNDPTLIFTFFKSPFSVAGQLLQSALQDSTAILFSNWGKVINPNLFDLSSPASVAVLVFGVLVAVAAFVYLSRTRFEQNSGASAEAFTATDATAKPVSWRREAFLLGTCLTVLGPVPAWVTGQAITTDNPLWSDRFGLASMLGASLVLVAALETLVTSKQARTIILCGLLGLSAGWHVSNANAFRRAWIKQSDFYQQLSWRAPNIEPGTAIFSDSEIFPYMGDYPTSFALGTLYPRFEDSRDLSYYFFSLSKDFEDKTEDLLAGVPLRRIAYSSRFLGKSLDSLVVFFEPESFECLWVLGPQDYEIRVLPDITRQALPISNLDRIRRDAPEGGAHPEKIFGAKDQDTWCYYFQSASLARQFEDWPQVIKLWEQAGAHGLAPGNGVEMLPFIEAFAHLEAWEKAADLSFQADDLTRMMGPSLCTSWRRIEEDTPDSELRRSALEALYPRLGCPPP